MKKRIIVLPLLLIPALPVTKTLNDFEEILEGYGFIMIHKVHLVNTLFIRSFHKNDRFQTIPNHTEGNRIALHAEA